MMTRSYEMEQSIRGTVMFSVEGGSYGRTLVPARLVVDDLLHHRTGVFGSALFPLRRHANLAVLSHKFAV